MTGGASICGLSTKPRLALRFRKCQGIRIDRKLRSADLVDVLSDQFILRDMPDHVRSDNDPKFMATAVQQMIAAVGARSATARAWTQKLTAEFLNDKIFYSLTDARIVFYSWRQHYPGKGPHSPLRHRPPAQEVIRLPVAPKDIQSATGPLYGGG